MKSSNVALLVCGVAWATLACTGRPTSPATNRTATPPVAAVGGLAYPTPAVRASGPNRPAVTAPDGRSYVITNPRFDALPGARALYGEIAGAAYEIEVPTAWNGALVLYAHGFTGNDPLLFVQPPPLRQYFVDQGFAWAASSYATSGYNPEQGVADTLALRNLFLGTVGVPRRTYIDGTSMGGHVVVSLMEQHPDVISGGFSECGVVAGVEELDYLTSYVVLGSYLTSVSLLPITDVQDYLNLVHGSLSAALGPPNQPTAAGKQFEDAVMNLTGGSRPWRHRGFVDRRTANFELAAVEDPRNRSVGARAATNSGVRYRLDPLLGVDPDQLNARVLRVPADPEARNAAKHPDYAPRTGMLRAPLLTLHTTGDQFVPISLEQGYRRAVDAAGAGDLLVQRAIRRPDHCQFTPQELQNGFADLVAWVEQGVKPAGDDLAVSDLRDVGRRFTLPLLPGDPGEE